MYYVCVWGAGGPGASTPPLASTPNKFNRNITCVVDSENTVPGSNWHHLFCCMSIWSLPMRTCHTCTVCQIARQRHQNHHRVDFLHSWLTAVHLEQGLRYVKCLNVKRNPKLYAIPLTAQLSKLLDKLQHHIYCTVDRLTLTKTKLHVYVHTCRPSGYWTGLNRHSQPDLSG